MLCAASSGVKSTASSRAAATFGMHPLRKADRTRTGTVKWRIEDEVPPAVHNVVVVVVVCVCVRALSTKSCC